MKTLWFFTCDTQIYNSLERTIFPCAKIVLLNKLFACMFVCRARVCSLLHLRHRQFYIFLWDVWIRTHAESFGYSKARYQLSHPSLRNAFERSHGRIRNMETVLELNTLACWRGTCSPKWGVLEKSSGISSSGSALREVWKIETWRRQDFGSPGRWLIKSTGGDGSY
jgi:hypothetical protein